MTPATLRRMARIRMAVLRLPPARLLFTGYLLYTLAGWVLLTLPVAHADAPVAPIDALFLATSAVSTTGLVTVDPGTVLSPFGEGVILLLIQIGGLGYMTLGSFATLALQHRLRGVHVHTLRHGFHLPPDIRPAAFVSAVVGFTFACEALGALLLYPSFVAAGHPAPLWQAVFHSVSAFCTAGFSLLPDSLVSLAGDPVAVVTASVLSILGAMGFLIVVDIWRTMTGQRRHLGFTSKVIVRLTAALIGGATLILFVSDPVLGALPPLDRLSAAFFQAMTASTTVGFNSVAIDALAPASIVVLLFLMVVGASPAGTGGGLKTTSLAALMGLVRSALKGRDRVRFFHREIPAERVQLATASLAFYMALLVVALTLLLMTEPGAAFEALLFEAVSAMGTVGLSLGATGGLSDLGKLVIVVLMFAGRVGILTFGVALARKDETPEEEADNSLVM